MSLSLPTLLSHPSIPDLSQSQLVRHTSAEFNLPELADSGRLEVYQSYQSKPVFKAPFLFAFLGVEGTKALFYGAFKVVGFVPLEQHSVPAEEHVFAEGSHFYCTLEKMPEYTDLEKRLVIDWGKGALAWVQAFTEKPVVEIKPAGAIHAFPGYLNFTLNHSQLKELIQNPGANPSWFQSLSRVGGVYLITNTLNGELYVGSATGAQGIWGRWSDYAASGHGGNKYLKEAMETEPVQLPQAFQYTILTTFPAALDKHEQIAHEHHWMKKLGTKAHGLNG